MPSSRSPSPAEHAGDEAGGDQERALDQEVEQRGDEARADAGQREVDVDAFRRGDADPVLILHRPVKLDRFVEERRPGWAGLEALLPRRGREARAPRAGAACAVSAASIGRPRPISPSRAGHSRTSRSRGGSSGSSPTVARPSTRDQGSRRSLWWFLSTGYWRRVLSGRGRWSPRWCCCSGRSRSRLCGRSTIRQRRSAWCRPSSRAWSSRAAGPTRRAAADAGGAGGRDLHEQHPRDVRVGRRRHLRGAGHGRGADLQRRLHRRGPRPLDRERLERRGSWSSSLAARRARAVVHRRRRRAPACGSAGRWSSPGR